MHLYCGYNKSTNLPLLNNKLQQINCNNNLLTYLPPLNKITNLDCSHNLLTYLPPLNKLIHLYCSHNLLTYLPPLNDELGFLYCSNNKLLFLPNLKNLPSLYCHDNPIYDILKKHAIGFEINYEKNNKWNHFREFYFLSKLRKKFVSWMWKSREERIRQRFHPNHLHEFFKNNLIQDDDNASLDIFLNKWINNE
jgi:hypothetical protein